MISHKAFGDSGKFSPEDPLSTRSFNHDHETRRVSTASSSSRNSGVDMRRLSFGNSLQVPKNHQQQQHHHHEQQPQQINTDNQRRKWNRYRQSEGFDFDPLGGGLSSLTKGNRSLSSSPKSGSTTANDQESGGSNNNNDSGMLRQNAQSEEEKQKVKEAGQLASVFLEMRKNIMSDFNIDLEHNESLDLERDKNIPGQVRLRNISRATIQRAEKVKVMLNLYYFYVFNTQRETQSKFAGVDGVYNPLQVIRNRRIRKKYHQPPKLAIKTLPYASTVFSRSKHKLVWQVDLTELTYDFNWRAQHWHELVNPHGELWFPPEDDGTGKHHHHHRHHDHHHPHLSTHHHHSSEKELSYIHDKLFENDVTDEYDSSNNSSKDDVTSMATRSRKRDKLTSKIRRRSKSPYKKKKEQDSKEQLNDGFEYSGERSNADSLGSNLFPMESNGSFKGNLLNDISIEPIKNHQRVLSSSDSNGQSNDGGTGTNITGSSSSKDSDDLEIEELKALNNYLQKLRKLDDLMNFGEHHLTVKEREYSQLINFQKVIKESEEIRQNSRYLKENVLAKYDGLMNEKSSSLEYYQNELTNNYSPRVDKLLLLSDRTIGEVNTTLSLEVRKLSERLEKLGPSYKRTGSLVSLAYWLLENLIVLLLWSIWIGFSIGRMFRFFIMLIWKVIKWVFY